VRKIVYNNEPVSTWDVRIEEHRGLGRQSEENAMSATLVWKFGTRDREFPMDFGENVLVGVAEVRLGMGDNHLPQVSVETKQLKILL
jgi:hypothetical protein